MFSGRPVLGWTQKSLHSSTGPFPTLTLGFASLNGVWLLQGYRNCSEAWAQPQGEARTPPELVPASTPTKQGLGPDPHQAGRAGPRGQDILLCSRTHGSPKDITRRVPGIFSGRGSEGTSGSSICSCKKQRIKAVRHNHLVLFLERTASCSLSRSQRDLNRTQILQHASPGCILPGFRQLCNSYHRGHSDHKRWLLPTAQSLRGSQPKVPF